jgi:hypothetical protein
MMIRVQLQGAAADEAAVLLMHGVMVFLAPGSFGNGDRSEHITH